MLNNKRHKSYETYIEKNLLMEGMEILICRFCVVSYRNSRWFCSFTVYQKMKATGASFLCCLSKYP